MKPFTKFLVVALILVVLTGIAFRFVDPEKCPPDCPGPTTEPPGTIQISIASSITKREWLDAAVKAFNADSRFQVNGKRILVEVLLEKDPLSGILRHWNSPPQVFATLREEIKPTILSPASSTWIRKLNKEWRGLYGKDISSNPEPASLLSTPVVIAMWESRARALGCWPDPAPDCTWKRIRDLATSPDGWGTVGHPEWGAFKFGYAYVGESDVGTQTAVMFCLMGIRKTEDLTIDDVTITNGCGQAIADIENAIEHRGTSSPLILEAMWAGGPAFLGAVTTYEKNVIGFNAKYQTRELLVSVYPQDGTVIANHPYGIMDKAPWVTDEQVLAARVFQEFLLSTEQQQAFLPHGLRPSESSVLLDSPIDQTHGANPNANLVTLQAPEVSVIDRVIEVWLEVKKPASIVLVFDKSGSMQGPKNDQAVNGAIRFVREIGRKDWLFWLPFDSKPYPGVQGLKSDVGEQLEKEIGSTVPFGETALYDAIAHAYQELEKRRERQGNADRYGIVVLSDGRDTRSETTLTLLEKILTPAESERAGIQVHVIGIGEDADDQALTKIANFTNGGRYWKVEDPDRIETVYKRISKYW